LQASGQTEERENALKAKSVPYAHAFSRNGGATRNWFPPHRVSLSEVGRLFLRFVAAQKRVGARLAWDDITAVEGLGF